MMDITLSELEAQHAELLPARETLINFNFADVWASNSSVALNLLTEDSNAISAAVQSVVVEQR